ncbi:MAG: phosphoglycerate dehydrogenase [Longicatena sp.]|nr:phosphoglycerate dehydrogenase [Longicatena sp.]
MKVKLFNKISQIGLEQLGDGYEISEDFENYDAVLVRSAKLHDTQFPSDLKCIARAGAGVNNIPLERCAEEGIVVFNTPGANANAVKELVVAALLLSGRKIVQGINWVKTITEEDMSKVVEKGKSNFVGPEVLGKKLGVIGLGAIGVQVANVAAALGMEVYGYDPYISVDSAWELKRRIHHANELKTIFEECDYITVHVPYMEATKNIVSKEAFAQMKNGVRILNFARGGLIDEEALKENLASEKVACYVTDFPNQDLMKLENVIAIPHLGASTPESEDNCAVMAAKEIKDYLENGNIVNSVNMPNLSVGQASKYRICVINRNVPEVISSLTRLASYNGVNIENMYNRSKKDYSYTLLETDDEVSEELLAAMRASKGIINVRLIKK